MTEAAAAAETAVSGPGFAKHPGYAVDIQPAGNRVRVTFNGETIVDTDQALLVLETKHAPIYYFRREDVRMDFTQRTEHTTFCPFKGEASYWTLTVGDKTGENVFWSYETPYLEVPDMKDLIGIYWDRMDAWYENGAEVSEPADPRS
jgi:uncharacterized protein (DUF427 family)